MTHMIGRLFWIVVKLFFSTAMGCILITIIPLIQYFLVDLRSKKEEIIPQRQVIAEVIRTPKREQPKQAERIRTVNNPTSSQSGKGSGVPGAMQFNFVPDLSVEGSGPGIAVSKGDFAPVVFEQGQTDEDVTAIYRPMPSYPAAARELGIEGDAEVQFIVNTTGKIESVSILVTPHPSFDAEIRRTLSTWRFKPARNQGIPVRLRVKQVIKFTLDEEN